MTFLNKKQLKDYKDNGYVSPINVLTTKEAYQVRKEIEEIESLDDGTLFSAFKNRSNINSNSD